MPKTNEFKSVKILKSDWKKLKKWSAVRDIKIYEIISQLVK